MSHQGCDYKRLFNWFGEWHRIVWWRIHVVILISFQLTRGARVLAYCYINIQSTVSQHLAPVRELKWNEGLIFTWDIVEEYLQSLVDVIASGDCSFSFFTAVLGESHPCLSFKTTEQETGNLQGCGDSYTHSIDAQYHTQVWIVAESSYYIY